MRNSLSIDSHLSEQVWTLADLLVQHRLAEAINSRTSSYPVYRRLHYAARLNVQEHFDQLALSGHWSANRLDAWEMILEGDGVLIHARGGRKAGYCSCNYECWAQSIESVNRAFDQIKTVAGSARIVDPMFSVNWHFVAGKGELKSASIEEMADDQLVDAAYPDLAEGIVPFISRYLDSPESVLVVQGPPGTGKTRLIRAILGEISRRNGGGAQALYTGDKRALESDEIFVEFITGWDDAFVVEDADHLLKPRADGNENLHRFLTIADGVVRAQGRKIIFSTNLPNVGDLDDALIRPGRCFALVRARALNLDEAMHLLRVLVEGRPEAFAACQRALPTGQTSFTLAELYKCAARFG